MRRITHNLGRLAAERPLSLDYLAELEYAADEDDLYRFLDGVDDLLKASRQSRLTTQDAA
jgi:hypothetical protein